MVAWKSFPMKQDALKFREDRRCVICAGRRLCGAQEILRGIGTFYIRDVSRFSFFMSSDSIIFFRENLRK